MQTRPSSSDFEHGFPRRSVIPRICDQQDLERAVEAYRFFYPAVSAEGYFDGPRSLGLQDCAQMVIVDACPRHVVFTANSDTPYAWGTLDLRTMGPVVVELPPGPFVGLADDHYQSWIVDMGLPGPDGGKGGRYVILPPGWDGKVPSGHHVAQSRTYMVMLALRAIPTLKTGSQGAIDALRSVKVHALSHPSSVLPYVDVSERSFDATPREWENELEYWRRLHRVIEEEPTIEEYRPMYGVLASLGIQKGRPFTPDLRTRGILEQGAKTALGGMLVEAFASGRSDRLVWPGRQWEWVGLVPDDANFETKHYLDLQARDRWFVQAIETSPAMFRREVGSGWVYFLVTRDQTGAFLEGSRSYKLNVPGRVPASLFWSVTAYDTTTRSQVRTARERAVLGSLGGILDTNCNGSFDLHFGPTPPPRKREQWIETIPGAGFFLYFRIYGPEPASLDGSWKLGDMVRVRRSR
jgi:hypothetical protein